MYSLVEIERRLKSYCSSFILDNILLLQVQNHFKKKLNYSHEYMDQESLILLLTYLKDNEAAYFWLKEIKQKIKALKRKFSTTHRIEVAYKTHYRCNMCNILLPPTFEVDHVIELWEGGKDEYENLQALCPNCHAKKTRANVLKKDERFKKEFTKRAREYEENAFEQFHFNKKSKYF